MYCDVEMHNGKILKGETIDKLVIAIINQFADEKLSVDEGKEILDRTKEVLGEFSVIEKLN